MVRRNDTKIILQQLREFKKIYLTYRGPMENFIFKLSDWDWKMVKKYKETRNILSKYRDDYPIIDEHYWWMPRSVWFFRSYSFEITFIIFFICNTYVYFVYIPVFKGISAFWVAYNLFVFIFWRIRIANKKRIINTAIIEMMRELEKLHK